MDANPKAVANLIAQSAPLFEFRSPLWLFAIVPLLAWIAWAWRQSLVDAKPKQHAFHLLTRLLMVILFALALARPFMNRPSNKRCWVLLVDRSQSIGMAAREETEQRIAELREACRSTDAIVRIDFASEPSSPRRLDQKTVDEREDGRELARLRPLGTDLKKALSLAVGAAPTGFTPHIVLFSDGNATIGNTKMLGANLDVPVTAYPLSNSTQEIQISSVEVPPQRKLGEPFDVEVVVNSTFATEAQLELFRDQLRVDLGSQSMQRISPGETRIRIRQQVDEARRTKFTARVSAEGDTQLDDNSASAVTLVAGQPRILVIDNAPDSVESFRWALEDHQMSVDVRPPVGMPQTLTDLVGFDALVLSDVSATQLSDQQLQHIATYVTELGGGVIMLGSENTFGLGGYYRTPLESILPVSSQSDQEREKPSLSMLLVIDRSGSMGGQKLSLAGDAAKAAVELLGARDEIGIIAFDDDAYWVSELATAANKPEIYDRIDRLQAAGGTNMFPAMKMGFEALRASTAKTKHMLILGDGISSPADFRRLTQQIVAQTITVSTVALGAKADRTLLREIAEQGAGRYYECEDPKSVPQVFARETMLASASAIDEEPFIPSLVRPSRVLRSIDLVNAPLLLGSVATKPKPTSELVLANANGDPLLAWWRHGMGMTLAFTSDAKPRWAVEWLAWPDFPSFWAQCVRHIARRDELATGEVSLELDAESAQITVDLTDSTRQYLNGANVIANVITPNDEQQQLRLDQSASGRYRGGFAVPRRGTYHVAILANHQDQMVLNVDRTVVVGFPEELRIRPPNTPLLRRLAAETNGLFEPTISNLLEQNTAFGHTTIPLWSWFIKLAIATLLLDTALRRLA